MNRTNNTTENPAFKLHLHIYHFISYLLSRKSLNIKILMNDNGSKSSKWERSLGLRVATGRFIIAHTSVKSVCNDFGKLMRIAKEINKKNWKLLTHLHILSVDAYHRLYMSNLYSHVFLLISSVLESKP